MTLKYFKYELKKSIWPLVVLTILGLLFHVPQILFGRYAYNGPGQIRVVLFLIACCILTVIYEFSFIMKKRSVDYIYGLPIKRNKIILFKFLLGFIKIFISYTIIYFLGVLFSYRDANDYKFIYFLEFYLLSLVSALSLYAFISFVYLRANTIIDGLVFIFLYSFIFLIIYYTINKFTYDLFNKTILKDFTLVTPYTPLFEIARYYDRLLDSNYITFHPTYSYSLTMFLFFVFIGIISFIGLYFSPRFDKAERAEQISNSYFGYKVLIPLITVCLIYVIELTPFNQLFNSVFLAIFLCGIIVLYIIYQRTFKLNIKYWIIFISTAIFGIILASV